MIADPEPVVLEAEQQCRYHVFVGGELAGLTQYADRGNRRVFLHTVVDDRFEGRGLASVLIAAALADVRSRQRRIVALCPFVGHYLLKHREWETLVDSPTAELVAEFQ